MNNTKPLPGPGSDRDSEVLEHCHALLDAVSDRALCRLDREGKIRTWNLGARHLYGYEPDQMIGENYARLFTQADAQAALPADILETALANGRSVSEIWQQPRDGSAFRAFISLDAMRTGDGGFALMIAPLRDLGNDAEERRLLLFVQATTTHNICLLDPSGIITSWNAGSERLTGYSADEMIGTPIGRIFAREERLSGTPLQELQAAVRSETFELESWRVRKDGSRFQAHVTITPIRDDRQSLLGFGVIMRDITARRAAEKALVESERQFQLLVAGVTDYALFMLDPNGIVTSWNSGAERIKGYKASEIIGHHFSRFYTDTDRAAGLPLQSLLTATREGKYEAEGWRVDKYGRRFWASVVIDAIRDEGGALLGFAKITRDITERRNAQIALSQAQQRTAQAQKMEAIGQLTGGVAHDFNNLLTIIAGYAQTLRGRVSEPKDVRAAEAIQAAAARGERLTRQLLSFSRRQRLSPVPINLAERVEPFRDMLMSSLRPDIRLVTHIPADIWNVEVDAAELELALVNIALNARDAISGDGVVSLTADNLVVNENDRLGIEGEFVVLMVTDSGGGIPANVLPSVFEPFFTTKPIDKGTGLGLAQVHGFAHQSGGTVTVSSEVGRGTTIAIYLPRSRTPVPSASLGESNAETQSAPNQRILVVEDSAEVAEVTVLLLEQLGYRVQTVANAQEALKRIRDGERFDLVFSDIVMPGPMNGLEFARVLRKLHPELPVLLTSGYSDAARQARDEFSILRKPFQVSALGSAIEKAMFSRPRAPPAQT